MHTQLQRLSHITLKLSGSGLEMVFMKVTKGFTEINFMRIRNTSHSVFPFSELHCQLVKESL